MLARLYRKAGPHEALIVYGFRGTRIVHGHGTVIFPMVENCKDLSLELMSFDVAPQQDLYTKQGVAVTVEAVAQIKVKSDKGVDSDGGGAVSDQDRPGARKPDSPGDGRPSARDHRPAHGGGDRQAAGDGGRADALTCADDINKMGLEVISFTIKEVRDKNEYISNMGRPDVARIKRDADVAAAEAERDTAIKRARPCVRPRSPRRKPTRNACWPKRCRRPHRRKPSATSK